MCGLLTGDVPESNAIDCRGIDVVDSHVKAIEAPLSSSVVNNVDRRCVSSTVTSQSSDVISRSLFTNTNIYGGNFNIVLNSSTSTVAADDVCQKLPLPK